MRYNAKIWQQVIDLGRQHETKVTNGLDEDDLNTILATMEFHNATDIWLQQTMFDLKVCKYKVYDWLAMCVMSRNNDNRKQNEQALKVLVHSFIKSEGNWKKFIADLRETDYQIDTSYEKIQTDVDEKKETN